jgi:type II secretory pathway component PulF
MRSGYRDLLAGLASLLESGVPIVDALEALSQKPGSRHSAELTDFLHQEVARGRPLSEALTSCSPPASPEAVALLRAGEASGALPEALRWVVAAADQRRERLRTLVSQTGYLAFVFVGALLLLAAMTAPRWVLVALVLAIAGSAALGLAELRRSRNGLGDSERLIRALPWLRKLHLEQASGQALRVLGRLIKSGLPLSEALPLSAGARDWLRQEFAEVGARLERKQTAPEAFGSVTVFHRHPELLARLAAGDRAGELDRALEEVGEHLEAECDGRLQRSLRWLPIVLTLAVGAIVLWLGVRTFSGLYSIQP